MKYYDIEPMCRPRGIGIRGCPHDGLGCPYGELCSINSPDARERFRAYNAGSYAEFVCHKRNVALKRTVNGDGK